LRHGHHPSVNRAAHGHSLSDILRSEDAGMAQKASRPAHPDDPLARREWHDRDRR
jgi:hypothetical protein